MGNTKSGVIKIKEKYGSNIYRIWGARGGNPLLIAQGRGDAISVRRRRSGKA